MRSRSRFLASLVLALALLSLCPQAARAQDFFFAFLIQNGWQGLFANPVTRTDQGLTTWATFQYFYPVVNGQKGSVLGNAYVQAWTRSVPDPFFAPIKPLAGLITLDFGGFRGHLGLIETPAGLQTTIGIIDNTGNVNTMATGTWVFGDGAGIVGGTANDMVIGGLVRFHTPLPLGAVPVETNLYFPTVPFPSDPLPMTAVWTTDSVAIGSFYGYAQGPLRTYRRTDTQWTGFTFDGSLLVMHTQADNYVVMACTAIGPTEAANYLSRCTVSGTGSFLAPLTGSLASFSIGLTSVFNLQVSFAP